PRRRPPPSTLFPYTTLFRSFAVRLIGERIVTPDGMVQSGGCLERNARPHGSHQESCHIAHPGEEIGCGPAHPDLGRHAGVANGLDRKSTRLNSSHVKISYAV